MEKLQQYTGTSTHGILLCLIGFLLCYFVGRRRFRRRGIGGIQYYSSYSAAVITTLFEKLLKIVGIILIIAGLFSILNSRAKQQPKKDSQKVTAVETKHHHHIKSSN